MPPASVPLTASLVAAPRSCSLHSRSCCCTAATATMARSAVPAVLLALAAVLLHVPHTAAWTGPTIACKGMLSTDSVFHFTNLVDTVRAQPAGAWRLSWRAGSSRVRRRTIASHPEPPCVGRGRRLPGQLKGTEQLPRH